jgi:hypothetical protein
MAIKISNGRKKSKWPYSGIPTIPFQCPLKFTQIFIFGMKIHILSGNTGVVVNVSAT